MLKLFSLIHAFFFVGAAQGLMYNATFTNVSSGTSSVDIWALETSAAVPILIHEWRMTSAATVDTRLSLQILRRTTAHTGGTTITPKPLNKRNTVAAATGAFTFDTTPGTGGDIIESELWSVLVPFSRIYTPDERTAVGVSSFICLFFATAPGGAVNLSSTVTWEEM
jgi:hypothetical protein